MTMSIRRNSAVMAKKGSNQCKRLGLSAGGRLYKKTLLTVGLN